MIYSINEALPLLEDLMSQQTLAVFAGSGVSKDSGLPTWEGMIDLFIELAESLPFDKSLEAKKTLDSIIRDSKLRRTSKQFDPILIASSLKKALKNLNINDNRNALAAARYNAWVSNLFVLKKPNAYHNLIIKTTFQFVLTTNYDLLFEQAADDMGVYQEWPSYSYKDQLPVISSINNKKSCIIHVHGTAADLSLDELIFTQEDYNKLILKKYEGFSFALRMLFTRFSTLFIGYGASDPHLNEVFEEIAEYFPLQENSDFRLPQSYILMRADKVDSLFEARMNRLRISIIRIDNYDDNLAVLRHLNAKFPK